MADAGADVLVAGSAILGSSDVEKAVKSLKKISKKGAVLDCSFYFTGSQATSKH